MDDKPTTTNHNLPSLSKIQSQSNIPDIIRSLPENEKKMCDAIHKVNQLRTFKLDFVEILEWKDTIIKLIPNIHPEVVEFAVEKMLTGELDYNKDYGIKNIFIAIREVIIDEDGEIKLRSQIRY